MALMTVKLIDMPFKLRHLRLVGNKHGSLGGRQMFCDPLKQNVNACTKFGSLMRIISGRVLVSSGKRVRE